MATRIPGPSARIITLLTDFGVDDPFVGVMKGAILSVNPAAKIVDLSHGIGPQDVVQAGYVLVSSYLCFPKGTIHVAVVDPGVGSERRIIGVELDGHTFLAPDNGLLELLLQDHPITRAVWINRAELFRQPVSATFHGRDIFAPVAGYLSLGTDLADVGPIISDVFRGRVPSPTRTPYGLLQGEVICIDRFGNLITNIRAEDLATCIGKPDSAGCEVRAGERVIVGIRRTYSDVPPGKALAVIGSIGRLEIAVHMGNAAQLTGCTRGSRVFVRTGGHA